MQEQTRGAADVDGGAERQSVEVLRHFAATRELGVDVFEVDLDDEVKVALDTRVCDRRVCADLDLAVDLG